MKNKKTRIFDYFLLFFAVAVYSCCSLCNKLASAYPILSIQFVFLYGCSIMVLAVYAVLWQIILKKFELSIAYSAKPFSTILSMLWGVLIFHEEISWNMILGTGLILLGMQVVVTDRE